MNLQDRMIEGMHRRIESLQEQGEDFQVFVSADSGVFVSISEGGQS